jgi:hypothetical protein
MKAKNIEPTTNGLVDFYSEFTNDMVFSKNDKKEIKENIEKNYPDINFHFTDILMDTPLREKNFAKYIISKFHSH